MIKRLENFSEEERFFLLAYGISHSMECAAIDKENYEKFKSGNLTSVFENELVAVNILKVLDELGYPMEELGTYFFKDVILQAYNELSNINQSKNSNQIAILMEDLSNAFSCLYRSIARDDKEIGIKPFHLYIEKAIEMIDYNKVNQILSQKIFGNCSEIEEYGFRAFQIAMFLKGDSINEKISEYKKPLTKRLSSMPDGLCLKKEF